MILNKLTAPLCENDIKSNWVYTDKVYISCVCISFNQKDYIRDTIDGFLAQETEYCFEIIIHDDASTDGIRDILLDYEQKYPSIIKLIIQDENQYSKGRRITPIAVSYASGEYIALCEGDDFWIDKQKLQKQIQIFIDDKNVSLVHTGVLDLVQKTGDVTESKIPSFSNTTESLFGDNRIRTLTTMFPKCFFVDFFNENKEEVDKWLLCDWPLWIYLSTKGEVYYIDNVTSVYRILLESASHFTSKEKEIKFTNSLYSMLFYMDSKYSNRNGNRHIISNKYIKSVVLGKCNVFYGYDKDASFIFRFIFLLNKFSFFNYSINKLINIKSNLMFFFRKNRD